MVLHRRQVRGCGVTRAQLRSRLKSGRWQSIGPVVIVAHNGPLTVEQRRWAAVLNAGDGAALGGRTTLEVAGLRGWECEDIHLVVPRGRHPAPVPAIPVIIHQSRRDPLPTWGGGPPRTSVERATIDAASWSKWPRSCAGILAAVVQQRLTTPDRLLAALQSAGHIPQRRLIGLTLIDIEGGAQALSEIDFGRLLRQRGLNVTVRQAVRLDGLGKRRYLDGVVTGPDGTEVAFEVDGAVHLAVNSYWRDMQRDNELMIAGQALLRFPSTAYRTDPERVIDQIWRALNAPSARRCA